MSTADTVPSPMETLIEDPGRIARVCTETRPEWGLDTLVRGLRKSVPGLAVEWAMTRGHWHRLGGVVDAEYKPVTDNIAAWAEAESGGDVEALVASHLDKGWFATRLAGKTHFFTLPCGDAPEEFIQLEVEELQAVLDRPLVDRDWYPDSLEEFLDPLDYPRLEPDPVGRPSYLFRRITPVAKLLREAPRENQSLYNLRRLFRDWRESSASEGEPFCRHWVLALRSYMDSDGECRTSARPVSTYAGELPALPPGETLRGATLANAIHGYDRRLGYAFAWYFVMLSRKSANYALAEAVLRDLQGAYAYLPARDLKVLRQWEERPYGV